MTTFDERERAAEKKFALEAEEEFKSEARRNKKLAHWACELLGSDNVQAYVSELIMSDMEEAGDDDVFRKLRRDFDDAGVEISDTAIRDKMDVFHKEARLEIHEGR